MDECAEDPDVCGEGKLCINNVGSYTCTCPEGYAENSGGVCEGEVIITAVFISSLDRPNT